jgi:hypothetical protein
VPQNFLFPQRDQPLLMPVDMREWLPEDDLVYVVLDAVATLDLGEFRRRYRADGHGRAAFGPEMMVALLLYGYCQGERSSRVIEKRCVRDVAYRVIAGGRLAGAYVLGDVGLHRPDVLAGRWLQAGTFCAVRTAASRFRQRRRRYARPARVVRRRADRGARPGRPGPTDPG